MTTAGAERKGPLTGIRVVEFAGIGPGPHAATLLATTALGAVEALQGCEYGLEIRVLCADALKRAASPQAPQARQRAVDYAAALVGTIRDARLKRRFAERPLVTTLFDDTPMPERSGRTDDSSPSLGSRSSSGRGRLGDSSSR